MSLRLVLLRRIYHSQIVANRAQAALRANQMISSGLTPLRTLTILLAR